MAQIKFSRNYPGVVPKAPNIPDGGTGEVLYLREDGTWAEPPGAGTSTLESLEDVDISDPESGQGLVYNEETGNWENGDVASDMEEITYEYYLEHKSEIEASDKTYLVTGPLVTPAAAGGGVNIYSTEEHVVGRWIDGKPIYEYTAHKTVNSTQDSLPAPANMDKLIDLEGFVIQPSGNITKLNMYIANDDKTIFFYAKELGTFYLMAGSSYGKGEWYITPRYTKTTDTPASLVPYVYPSSSIKGLVADTGTQQVSFRFTYDQATQKYGYLDGADTFHPFNDSAVIDIFVDGEFNYEYLPGGFSMNNYVKDTTNQGVSVLSEYFLTNKILCYGQQNAEMLYQENDYLRKYLHNSQSGSTVYIPIKRLTGKRFMLCEMKMVNTTGTGQYVFIRASASAVVNGVMLTTTYVPYHDLRSTTNWVSYYVDISSLPYVDYITTSNCDGAGAIRNIRFI